MDLLISIGHVVSLADVYTGIFGNKVVALKCLDPEEWPKNFIMKEARVHEELTRHQHILDFLGLITNLTDYGNTEYIILLEYAHSNLELELLEKLDGKFRLVVRS